MTRKARPFKLDKAQLRALYKTNLPRYEQALQDYQQSIRQLLDQHGLAPTMKYRVKRFETYYEKLRDITLGSRGTSQSLSDFLGLRIICPFLADIETIESILTKHYPVLEVERKVTQHSFREFGYDSVHLQVDLPLNEVAKPMPGTSKGCEIQLRTILQDAWAEVEHELVYKSDIVIPNESIRRKLAALNATLTLSDLIFQEIRDFQEELRRHGRKRRESLDWQVPSSAGVSKKTISPSPESFNSLILGPVPKTLTTELETLMLQALDAHSNQNFQMAVKLYSKLLTLKLEPKFRALIYNHRGLAFFAQGQTRLAFKDFSKAIQFQPNNIRSYVNRGLCGRVMKQFEQAIKDFNHVLDMDNEHEECIFGRAQCYFEMGLYDQALDDCKNLLQRRPEDQAVQHLSKLIYQAMIEP
ncbi:MAG: tetratricopeptide repeat protein [Deltaproteobacteria bacterium]|jgi:putative GTP pyrophosphokinase|nr:tetratricopeptide repeat protein [Deltaproteobacteria bacterium]MBW2520209.1 tetratricopeptide repeat protein [Deltaproteobacteria bacterium]